MKELMIIEINDEGTFEKSPEKIFYVPKNKIIMFQFIGRKFVNHTPLLLSNFKNTSSKKFQIEKQSHIFCSLKALKEGYNVFEGDYEDNLNWSCKILFNHSGLYFFQVLFIDKKFDGKYDNTPSKILVSTNFEYLIVNPLFKHFNEINQSKFFSEIQSSFQLDNDAMFDKNPSSPKVNSFPEANIAIARSMQKIKEISVSSHKHIHDNSTVIRKDSKMHTIEHIDKKDYFKYDMINLMSVFPTMMGPIEEWEAEFTYLINRGYQGFHLSPIQKVGASKSLYCLNDPLKLNEDIFGVILLDRKYLRKINGSSFTLKSQA